MRFLSTPSARRATRQAFQVQKYYEISIHALREEGDQHSGTRRSSLKRFLSTPSARRATTIEWAKNLGILISIHALREEGDRLPRSMGRVPNDFYPRPPRGGRRLKRQRKLQQQRFLSTPSARRATRSLTRSRQSKKHFYPRPPRGGRQYRQEKAIASLIFLSTPSARRATDSKKYRYIYRPISIHALREEGDS